MSAESYAKALAAFQAEIPHVAKSQTATVPTKAGGKYTYDFADLSDITAVALPKHGLSWSARPTLTEAGFVLRYRLMHAEGYTEDGDYPLPDPMKHSPQELGSAITYARRYSLVSVTGIAPGGEDDDGQKAEKARSAQSSRPATSAPSRAPRTNLPDGIVAARARVRAAGEVLGWSVPEIGDDFAKENGGLTIPSASAEQLVAYAEDLESRAQAVPA
jgi:hypothetical protein